MRSSDENTFIFSLGIRLARGIAKRGIRFGKGGARGRGGFGCHLGGWREMTDGGLRPRDPIVARKKRASERSRDAIAFFTAGYSSVSPSYSRPAGSELQPSARLVGFIGARICYGPATATRWKSPFPADSLPSPLLYIPSISFTLFSDYRSAFFLRSFYFTPNFFLLFSPSSNFS